MQICRQGAGLRRHAHSVSPQPFPERIDYEKLSCNYVALPPRRVSDTHGMDWRWQFGPTVAGGRDGPKASSDVRAVCATAPPASCYVQEAGSTPATSLTDAHRRIDAKCAPRCGVLAAGVDPPKHLGNGPLANGTTLSASHSGDSTPDCGHASLRALLRDARQKGADLSLPVPAVAAKRPD
jgi:hypothetical protein